MGRLRAISVGEDTLRGGRCRAIKAAAPPARSRTRGGRLKIIEAPPIMSWPTKADAPPAMSCGKPNSAWLKITATKMIASRLIFFLCFADPNCFSLIERGGSMLLRRRPLVQVLETQNRQQYNESERVRGDVEPELNQAVHGDAEDTND